MTASTLESEECGNAVEEHEQASHHMLRRSQAGICQEDEEMNSTALHGCRSRMLRQSVLAPQLIDNLREFAACMVLEKLVCKARDMTISAPMGNDARAEVLLNTKVAMQFSKVHSMVPGREMQERMCARCRGTNLETDPGACCGIGQSGCDNCVGWTLVCPTCGDKYQRRWTYETGCGRGSVGRNRDQFHVYPFTTEMAEMARSWQATASHACGYNNFALVMYTGEALCAHCALGMEHKGIQCSSLLNMHQDMAQRGGQANSAEPGSIHRTLNVGHPRTLTMELVQHLGSKFPIDGTGMEHILTDSSEFLLDTSDEREVPRATECGVKVCSWEHGMTTPIPGCNVSCGYVGREVRYVRDVRLQDDLVISSDEEEWQASMRGQEFLEALDNWKATKLTRYLAMTEVRVPKALAAWRMRSGRRSSNTT